MKTGTPDLGLGGVGSGLGGASTSESIAGGIWNQNSLKSALCISAKRSCLSGPAIGPHQGPCCAESSSISLQCSALLVCMLGPKSPKRTCQENTKKTPSANASKAQSPETARLPAESVCLQKPLPLVYQCVARRTITTVCNPMTNVTQQILAS